MSIKLTATIKVNPSLQRKLQDAAKIDRSTAAKIGSEIVSQIKDFTASGVSPIRGKGKFPRYKDPAKYPGKRKPRTPVNLRLTGAFMKGLKHEVISDGKNGYAARVFYQAEQEKKEQGHRDGAKGQPKRPTIPRGNESFAEKIKAAYIRIVQNSKKG